jgi:hypothetical protein
MPRPWIWTIIALAAVLLPGAMPARAAEPARIVAIGDLHGDHDAWIAIARAAGLVDRKGRWAGGKAVFVQLGDVTDRGPDSRKIIQDLMRLQQAAPRRGGKVIVLVGNHEAMNMTNDLRYVHPGEFAAFADRNSKRRRDLVYDANKTTIETFYRARFPQMTAAAIREEWLKITPLGKLEHQLAWSADGELGQWTISNPAAVKIGDTLFVHGGISAAYATIPIDDINKRVADALKAQDASPTSIINDPNGPLWYRGLVTRSGTDETSTATPATPAVAPLTIDQEVDLVLGTYGVKRIVVGHTPSLGGIISASNGHLWRADSANSRAYGGTPSYLEIIGDRVVAHSVPRPASKSKGRPQ